MFKNRKKNKNMQSIREKFAFMFFAKNTQYKIIFDHDKTKTKKFYDKIVIFHLIKFHEMFTKRYVDDEMKKKI